MRRRYAAATTAALLCLSAQAQMAVARGGAGHGTIAPGSHSATVARLPALSNGNSARPSAAAIHQSISSASALSSLRHASHDRVGLLTATTMQSSRSLADPANARRENVTFGPAKTSADRLRQEAVARALAPVPQSTSTELQSSAVDNSATAQSVAAAMAAATAAQLAASVAVVPVSAQPSDAPNPSPATLPDSTTPAPATTTFLSSGGSLGTPSNALGGGAQTIAQCIATWAPDTFMSKTEWRGLCQRTIDSDDLNPLQASNPHVRNNHAHHRSATQRKERATL